MNKLNVACAAIALVLSGCSHDLDTASHQYFAPRTGSRVARHADLETPAEKAPKPARVKKSKTRSATDAQLPPETTPPDRFR